MPERDEYPHGVFNWVDLCTTDTDAAKAFYSELFGLGFEDEPADDGGVYTVGYKNGLPVLGIMAQTPDMCEQGMPCCWETYIKVDDADTAAAAVPSAGGRLLGPVTDVASGAGRLAVFQDPTGAVAVLWQPLDHAGARLVKEHGTMSWNELVTTDVDRAMGFYSSVLGWSAEPMGEGGLAGIRHGGDGEIIGTVAPAPPGVPSNWAVYFEMDDCDAAVEGCLGLGGRVAVPASDQAFGRTAMLADGQGAVFWVITCRNH